MKKISILLLFLIIFTNTAFADMEAERPTITYKGYVVPKEVLESTKSIEAFVKLVDTVIEKLIAYKQKEEEYKKLVEKYQQNEEKVQEWWENPYIAQINNFVEELNKAKWDFQNAEAELANFYDWGIIQKNEQEIEMYIQQQK